MLTILQGELACRGVDLDDTPWAPLSVSTSLGEAGVEQRNLTYLLVPARRYYHGAGTPEEAGIAIDLLVNAVIG